MNVNDLLKLSLEERVRHLELYGTFNVDSWLDIILKRLDKLETAIADTLASKETKADADLIQLILAEDARIENGAIENIPYLTVKIAESVEATTEAARCGEADRF